MLAVILCAAFAPVSPASAQDKSDKGVTTKGEKVTKTRGADPHIKQKEAKNNAKKKVEAPTAKGGTQRGADHLLHVDNRTPWKIVIYIDGENVGSVSEWGDSYGSYSGTHSVYGVAYFEDGSKLTFGPKVVNFDDGDFTWTLTE